jgi:hypothetical protein
MNEVNLIDPIEKEIGGKTFIIGKLPAVIGREIITQYPIANIPKIGNYEVSRDLMYKLMRYVAVRLENGNVMRLETPALIDNHVPDATTLILLEKAAMQYNFDFLADGVIMNALESLLGRFAGYVTQMLTQTLDSSLIQDEQHSEN